MSTDRSLSQASPSGTFPSNSVVSGYAIKGEDHISVHLTTEIPTTSLSLSLSPEIALLIFMHLSTEITLVLSVHLSTEITLVFSVHLSTEIARATSFTPSAPSLKIEKSLSTS